jgi:hypothetical protein
MRSVSMDPSTLTTQNAQENLTTIRFLVNVCRVSQYATPLPLLRVAVLVCVQLND